MDRRPTGGASALSVSFFFQAEDGIRDRNVTGVQTCALPILFRHILPNILPLIFVLAAIDIGGIILAESALSFLGLGILPPTPSWGNMLTGATQYFVRAPYLVIPPGAMIFLTVLSLYLIGDGLRDALDP